MRTLFIVLIALISCNQDHSFKYDQHAAPLDKLKEGNARFMQGHSIHPDESLSRIKEIKQAQHPFVTIVSCSDSRIPPELIFDQGLGDIFTIRTAGNVIGDYELGSVEYAVEHLECKLIVVLGHESCGAIQAFLSSGNERHKDHIQNIIDYLSKEQEQKAILDSLASNPDLAVRANIQHGVTLLKNSTPILKSMYESKKVKIIGAYYDLDNGKVTFDETH